MNDLIDRIRSEPALADKLTVGVLGCDPCSPEALQAAEEVRNSSLVNTLLSERDTDGRHPRHPYAKWDGAHWLLSLLADLGYPPGDQALKPLVDQSLGWLLGDSHQKSIRTIAGLVRRCASQEGNAVWYSLKLGLADDRIQQLVEKLIHWQWPDGGWNCDKRPSASHSSFNETLIPLRALALYARQSGDVQVRHAAERAAEVFLTRQLFERLSDGRVIDENFILLHYPPYWHYDILFALKLMAEAGFIDDPRCQAALDMLESRRLPDGGFPAQRAYYRTTSRKGTGFSLVSWGGTSTRYMNPFVTADALYVLRMAGRYRPSSL